MDCRGTHLLADLYGCTHLADATRVEAALRAAVAISGATLLDLRLHAFGEGQGVTGVALLAESHLSIHTWPEHAYAAIDIFLCGRTHDIDAALATLVAAFAATRCERTLVGRGLGADPAPLPRSAAG